MAKIFRKMPNPYVLCAVTHSLTLTDPVIELKLTGSTTSPRIKEVVRQSRKEETSVFVHISADVFIDPCKKRKTRGCGPLKSTRRRGRF